MVSENPVGHGTVTVDTESGVILNPGKLEQHIVKLLV